MKTNIYPSNYFTPYDDLQEPEDVPSCIKADKKAAEIVEHYKDKLLIQSFELFNDINYAYCYHNLAAALEAEFAEILEDLYTIKGE